MPESYQEIRILYQNWESPMFTSWILQIFLSEAVRVPVTIEPSDPSLVAAANFYNPQNEFTFGAASYDYDALQTALEIPNGDCRNVQQPAASGSLLNKTNYISCGHVMPTVWAGQMSVYQQAEVDGLIEPTEAIGGVGSYGWYIPKYLAKHDPSLLSHFGLRGEKNRRKLANLFLRPTTWKDYCTLVSSNNCTTNINANTNTNNDTEVVVAVRPPRNSKEEGSYFVKDLYWGYFRKTEDNDCDKHPTPTCTGHITNVPCYWSTFVVQQAYHNQIHVKSSGPGVNGGYNFLKMQEIWWAANHTKSPVLMYWPTPDAFFQSFLGTDAELQRILLPPATQKCVDNRVTAERRCSATTNVTEQAGSSLGACDFEPTAYQKLIVSNLFENSLAKPEAERSPAYDAIKRFRISDLQISEIFKRWYERNIDRFGYDPREAVCTWVAENMDDLQRYIPRTYPRETQTSTIDTGILHWVAIVLGIVSTIMTLVVTCSVYSYRNERVIQYAQLSFLLMLLAGLLLISLGAIIGASTPTNASCISSNWFTTLGYTLELVPLIVKVSAINTLMTASRKMKRIKLQRSHLFRVVFCIFMVAVVFLTCWSILDPPQRQHEFSLLINQQQRSSTTGLYIVEKSYFCGSEANYWLYIREGWLLLLLVWAVVLAIQTRNVKSEFNESRRLVIMVYSHSLFVVMRVIILVLKETVKQSALNKYLSIVNSVDSLATLVIYFLPMFLALSLSETEGLSNAAGQQAAARPSDFSSGLRGSLLSKLNGSSHPSPSTRTAVSTVVSTAQIEYDDDDDTDKNLNGNNLEDEKVRLNLQEPSPAPCEMVA